MALEGIHRRGNLGQRAGSEGWSYQGETGLEGGDWKPAVGGSRGKKKGAVTR
jgi:hypothetical protein